jgi:hypothetical protein
MSAKKTEIWQKNLRAKKKEEAVCFTLSRKR